MNLVNLSSDMRISFLLSSLIDNLSFSSSFIGLMISVKECFLGVFIILKSPDYL